MSISANSSRLRAIMAGFSIPTSEVAKVAGVSKPYISRILSLNDDMKATDAFWIRLEKELGRLIDARKGQVFEVKAVDVENLEALAKKSA